MKNMIIHKTSYFSFTIRRTFFNYYKSSSKPPDSHTLNGSLNEYSFASSESIPPNISNILLKRPLIDPKVNGQHYDIAIIGGGSAGLALANEAYKLGFKAILFDYVEPSPQGTKWGLGGTCPNVGCIPKKLMHTAALHFEHIMHSFDFGWNFDNKNSYLEDEAKIEKFQKEAFSWETLVSNVQSHIKSTNFGYKSKLQEQQIPYVNAMAAFIDKNTLLFSPKMQIIQNFLKTQELSENDKENYGKITADYFVVATGGRPQFLNEKDCKNCRQLAITSDDIFSLQSPPNKTLIVGGGYIALECAGMLSGMGFPVNIMTRGLYLRTFDQGISDIIMEDVQKFNKVKVIPSSLPYEISLMDNGRKLVKWRSQKKDSKEESQDEFDTVLIAIGRNPNTKHLNLDKIGVKLTPGKKILGGFDNEAEQSSVSNIYALGDILENAPELTPVAAKSAVLLARRLAMKKTGKDKTNIELYNRYKMDYDMVPTTVFTPNEYSTCGLSEEKAIKKHGKENIIVYHSKYLPLEEYLNTHLDQQGFAMKRKVYCKIICNKIDDERVVGIHYVGPNAGEIMQGIAVAMRLGLKKKDLDSTVGIHPTTAEEITNLKVSKESGEKYEKDTC